MLRGCWSSGNGNWWSERRDKRLKCCTTKRTNERGGTKGHVKI